MVTVILGHDKPQTFHIYKEFACYYSPVFRATFNGSFLEGQSQSMTIDEDQANLAFGAIQHWMYTGKLHQVEPAHFTLSSYCCVWILADRLLMVALQNHVTRKILEYGDVLQCSSEEIRWIYDNTSPDGMLRKLVVDVCAIVLKGTAWLREGQEDGFPPQFLFDLALALKIDKDYGPRIDRRTKKVIEKVLIFEDYKVTDPTS